MGLVFKLCRKMFSWELLPIEIPDGCAAPQGKLWTVLGGIRPIMAGSLPRSIHLPLLRLYQLLPSRLAGSQDQDTIQAQSY